MKKFLFAIFIALSILGVVSGQAQEVDPLAQIEYTPRLLPTSPFYFLKQWKERHELASLKTAKEKAEKRLELANRRLAELRVLGEKRLDLAEQLAERYREQLASMEQEMQQIEPKERESLAQHVAAVTLKHQSILQNLLQKVPESAKKGIQNALEKSIKGHQQAVESVSKPKPTEKPSPTPKLLPQKGKGKQG